MWRSILDLLFPPRCVACRRPGTLLCSYCLKTAPRVDPPFCHKCWKPLGQGFEGKRLYGVYFCPFCLDAPPDIGGIRSPYLLAGPMRQAIHAFKYGGISSLAPILGHLLAEFLVGQRLPVEVVVPVPLHPGRRRERGYDQAELLARQVAKELGLPLGTGWVVRNRPTSPQVKTGGAMDRKKNVMGAFTAAAGTEAGRSVLLVDDVCTTGATLESCARALQGAGIRVIWGATMAREAFGQGRLNQVTM